MPDEQDLAALASLSDGQRRRVFGHVQAHPDCTVSELSEALGVGRTLVVFHLNRLLEVGLVRVGAPERRAGARGRPSQRYRATQEEVLASVPERRYDLLAGVLLDAVSEQRSGESAAAAGLRVAARRGTELALQHAAGAARLPAGVGRLEALLSSLGYLPVRDPAGVVLRNCPFDRFRADHTPEVCSINLALGEGYLDGLGLQDAVRARLRPDPDTCCVVFQLEAGQPAS